jgi:preprotein translocase subunit YajC
MQTLFLLLAQENQKPPEPPWVSFLPMIAIAIVAYFLLLRPNLRQDKERKALRSSIKKDDKILTTGGMYGTVVSVSDKEDEIVIRIADNVRIRMVKAAIDRNLTNEEAAREAKSGKPAATA